MNKTLLMLLTFSISIFHLQAQSWTEENVGFKNLIIATKKISIVDKKVAWCESHSPGKLEFSKTTDGGLNWVPGVISGLTASAGISGIAAISESIAFISVYNLNGTTGGAVFKTIDGGTSWKQSGKDLIFTNATSFPNDIYFWDAAKGIVIGDPVNGINEIYLTADSGITWNKVSSANLSGNSDITYTMYGPMAVVDSTVWFETSLGFVFKSTNRGKNWTKSKIPVLVGEVSSISFLDDKTHGLVSSFKGNKIYKTDNGGSSWTDFTPSGAGSWDQTIIKSIPGTNYFVCVNDTIGNSYYSKDFGNTWVAIDAKIPYFGLAFKDINTGYATGVAQSTVKGGISKWNAGSLGLNQEFKKNEIVIYPNPANEYLHLDFGSYNKNAKITISNIEGKMLFETSSLNLQIMELNIDWLKPAIYFIQIESDDFIETKKVIISK